MAFVTKFHCLMKDLCHGHHDWSTDQLAVFLTNTAPNSSTHHTYDGTTGSTGPAEIAAVNGYTAGGINMSLVSSDQSAGVYTLILADSSIVTASGGAIGPYRYLVLYNKANNKLIGWYDRGDPQSIASGKQFKLDVDQTNGVIKFS